MVWRLKVTNIQWLGKITCCFFIVNQQVISLAKVELVIELDGYTHKFEETQLKDKLKEEALRGVGLTVLRFSDDEVLTDIKNILAVIKEHIDSLEGGQQL